jgi:hypothetical protein
MRQGARARRRVVQAARALLGVGDELPHRLDAHVGTHGIDHRKGRHLGDLFEILERVVVDLVVEARVDDVSGRRHQDGVAVRLRPRGVAGADAAAGAATVLDDDRLPERLRQRLLDRTHHHVVGAARRERHEDGDGTFGKRGEDGQSKQGRHCEEEEAEQIRLFHLFRPDAFTPRHARACPGHPRLYCRRIERRGWPAFAGHDDVVTSPTGCSAPPPHHA